MSKIDDFYSIFGFCSVHGENCLKWPQKGLGSSFSGQSRPCRHFWMTWISIFRIFIFCIVSDSKFLYFQVPDFQTLAWAAGVGPPLVTT